MRRKKTRAKDKRSPRTPQELLQGTQDVVRMLNSLLDNLHDCGMNDFLEFSVRAWLTLSLAYAVKGITVIAQHVPEKQWRRPKPK